MYSFLNEYSLKKADLGILECIRIDWKFFRLQKRMLNDKKIKSSNLKVRVFMHHEVKKSASLSAVGVMQPNQYKLTWPNGRRKQNNYLRVCCNFFTDGIVITCCWVSDEVTVGRKTFRVRWVWTIPRCLVFRTLDRSWSISSAIKIKEVIYYSIFSLERNLVQTAEVMADVVTKTKSKVKMCNILITSHTSYMINTNKISL